MQVYQVSDGVMAIAVTNVDGPTGEVSGVFVSEQLSDSDMGAKAPKKVCIPPHSSPARPCPSLHPNPPQPLSCTAALAKGLQGTFASPVILREPPKTLRFGTTHKTQLPLSPQSLPPFRQQSP